jgi:hypothetical protein
MGGKCDLSLKIIRLEINFPHYENAALIMPHFQPHSGILYRFSSELPAGMISVT